MKDGRTDGTGGLSKRSVLHQHRVLHKALDDALKLQLITNNPAKSVHPPKPEYKQVNVLTMEQIETLLDSAEKYSQTMYRAIYLAIHTGMRRGEIGGLRWQDIDFDNQIISIRQTLIYSEEDGLMIRPTTKTDGSRRSISISEHLSRMFRNIKKQQTEERLSHGSLYNDQDLIFAYPNGEPIRISYYSQGFSKLVKQIKGLPYISFHGLRHLHATLLLQQGIHPKVVSERLGHKSIDITMNLYSHVMPNMQKEAVEKLDNLFFPKQTL